MHDPSLTSHPLNSELSDLSNSFPPTSSIWRKEASSMVNYYSNLLLPSSSSCSSLFLPLNPTFHTTLIISQSPPCTTQNTPIQQQFSQRRKNPKTPISASSSSSNKQTTRTSAIAESEERAALISPTESSSASDIVRNYYDGINKHDLASVEVLIAENCVYDDLIFPTPFVGRKAILEFFKKLNYYLSKDLHFVIDDIPDEDSLAVGVTWHVEWQGRPFPFTRGCSFYRLEVVNGKKQIIYGRDSVEPAIKPGEATLVGRYINPEEHPFFPDDLPLPFWPPPSYPQAAIKGVTWLLQRFPQLADRM